MDKLAAGVVTAFLGVAVSLAAGLGTLIPGRYEAAPVIASSPHVTKPVPVIPADAILDVLAQGVPGRSAFTPAGCDAPAPYGSVSRRLSDGVSMTASVYGAGLGGLAEQTCTNQVVMRRGDVVLFLSSESAVAQGLLAGLDLPECSDATGEHVRNPWWGGEFLGAATFQTVWASVDRPVRQALPPAKVLPVVTRPPAPDFPHTPLPAEVSVPVAPKEPAYPEASAEVRLRTRDDIGPGCGWEFTGLSAPTYNQQDVDRENAQRISDARAALDKNIASYSEAVRAAAKEYEAYLTKVEAYEAYAAAVAQVTQEWELQREQHDKYLADLQAFQDYQDAANQFAEDQAFCATLAPEETTESCPAVAPPILSSPAPTVPSEGP